MRPPAVAAVVALSAGLLSLAGTPANAAEADTTTTPTNVAIVMPLSVPITDPAVPYSDPKLIPTSSPSLMDAETIAYYTAPTGILSTELDAVYDSSVTIGIDPLIIASIRALGSEAPDSAKAWLDRLATASNPTFALTWADSDMTAPLQAGRRRIVQPTSLEFAIDPTRFSTASTANPTPDPTSSAPPADATRPPLPTSDELTGWKYTLPATAWPAADSVTTKDLTTIARSYDTTILSSTNVSRTTTTSAVATVDSHRAVISDTPLSLLVATALAATDVDAWDSAMASVTSSLAAVATASPTDQSSSVVLTLDRDTQLPTARLTATIAAIAALPSAHVVGLADISAASPASASLISEREDSARVARVKAILSEESTDARFATVADDPTLITGERRIRILNTLSPSVNRLSGGWQAATAEYLTDSTTLLQSVKLERSSDILLLGDTESIRPAVTNDLNQPVTVYIEVRSLSPNLKVEQSRVLLRIEPNYQRKASVPVQAISNGEVQLAVRLTTRENVRVGTTALLPITVRAGWEGPFTLIGGILVVLVFAAGIVRTIVRRRKARALGENEPTIG